MPSSPLSSRRSRLAAGWDCLERAGHDGPLDDRTCQLVELAIAVTAARGDARALRDPLQRARDRGITDEAIEQVIALAAPAIGKRATLAALDAADAAAPTAPDSAPRPSDG